MPKIGLTLLFMWFFQFAEAQKFYFTGIGLQYSSLSNRSTDREKAQIIASAAYQPSTKALVDNIGNDLMVPHFKESEHTDFLLFNFYLRPKKTNRFFDYSELITGIGYSPLIKNHDAYSYLRKNPTESNDTIGYFMERIIGQKYGFILESKFIVNSSPFKSRLMKYFGFGIRAASITEKNNRVKFTELHAYNNNEFYTYLPLSNTSNAMLGVFVVGGLKYNLSCKFNVFVDVSAGYAWRFYPYKISNNSYSSSLSFGLKYKMGNGPIDTDNSVPVVEDEKTKKRNKKKIQVYW